MGRFRTDARSSGWESALQELEHQAEHWDTPDHGEIGFFIAQSLRAAVDIARAGGLDCEHQPKPVVGQTPDERRTLRLQGLPPKGFTSQHPEAATDHPGLPRAG